MGREKYIMSTRTTGTGVELASGKAKGAEGVATMLRMCRAELDSSKFGSGHRCFTDAAVALLDNIEHAADELWKTLSNSDFSGMYIINEIGCEQRLAFGNIWLDIGRGYSISLHWEALTGLQRNAVEAAVLYQDRLLTDEPILFDFADGQEPGDVALWARVLMRAVGRGCGVFEEDAPFGD